jgi:hypothetical protein
MTPTPETGSSADTAASVRSLDGVSTPVYDRLPGGGSALPNGLPPTEPNGADSTGRNGTVPDGEEAGMSAVHPPRTGRRNRTSPDRVQRSFYLSRDLVDRARAAVAATMEETGEAYNVSQLASRGLEAEVRRLEERYNGGRPFDPVDYVRPGPSPEGVERIRAGVTVRRRRHDD